ncbi:hypothetical protein BP6252_10790 [Coleophoma cylindrospora]|uniref:Major facilitator superfamily (MFS) profile domain-containing protein n=1 Tax=Coleophoma cylindrospora TaxID=1849047 RepID=A0A3D8QTM3_9HELO|nr:hypothetical protein BP6252_10790 [Coleophoma cylindrospora]
MDSDKVMESDKVMASHVEHPHDDYPVTSKTLTTDAEENSRLEHQLSPREAIKAYPMAVFWCLTVSTCVIMEGFDQILMGSLFAYPTFQRKYGTFVGVTASTRSGYQLSAPWQAGLNNGSTVGAFFGTLINGYLVNKFGHRLVLLASLVILSGCIFITFFSPNVVVLLIGQILSGLPWGVFATAAPAYASECLPMPLRIYLTSYTNMCFLLGQLIAAGVLRGLQSRTDEWGFRIPFALQWVWPCFLIPLIYFAPASPWHEVRKGRLDQAEKSLRRLQRQSADIDVKKTLAMIVYTNDLEEQFSVGTSYWDCLKGFELRRTEIACMAFAGQVLSGSNFAYNSSYFYEQIGLPTSTTYSLTLGGLGVAGVATIINWLFITPNFGRRITYLWGMSAMAFVLYLIGILNVWSGITSVVYTQAVLAILWLFFFDLSVGQLGWSLPAEVGSTRLRQKTICLARNSYYLVNIVAGVLQPYFMNPTAWNLRGYTGFFWGGTATVMVIWAFFRLPETRHRSFEELDMLFARKIPARKFKHTEAGAYDADRKNEAVADSTHV